MSQFDFGTMNPATESGTQLAADLNAWRTALHSMHRGSARPAYAVAGLFWLKDSVTPWVLYCFDGADDIKIGTINATSNVFVPSFGALSGLVMADGSGGVAAATAAQIVAAIGALAVANAANAGSAAACSGNAATATLASTIADGAVTGAAKVADNVLPLSKLARTGTAGKPLVSGGPSGDIVVGDFPAQVNGVNGWVNFNGTSSGAITPRANLNIASVTKNGTGDYTLNIAGGAVADANYCAVGSASPDASSNLRAIVVTFEQTGGNTFQARTATSLRLTTRYGAGNDLWDPTTVCVALFR